MNRFLQVFIVWIWISLSEFVRNEFLFKSIWSKHFKLLGLRFPDDMINGLVWGLWALGFALVIRILLDYLPLWKTFLLAWFSGFVLMWLALGNLLVLPWEILPFAIPLSLLEVGVAVFIYSRIEAKGK